MDYLSLDNGGEETSNDMNTSHSVLSGQPPQSTEISDEGISYFQLLDYVVGDEPCH